MSTTRVPIDRRRFLFGAGALGMMAFIDLDPALAAAGRPVRRSDGRFVVSQRTGAYEVMALLDASGPFTLATPEQAFPNATADDWQRAERVDPGAFGDDGLWHLDFHCFAIRRPGGRFVLVDAGVGPEESPAAAWAPVPGRLPELLPAAGIDRADVDTVVLTHLHEDHVGWSVLPDGTPMFPDARYVVQQREVADLEAQGDEVILDYVVRPLRRTGQLHEVDGRILLMRTGSDNRITLLPTPGHTVGHQSVLVEGGRRDIVVTGDALVHAVQLVNPEVAYAFERDQAVARQTRQELLADAEARHALLATAHLTRPFVPARQG
ncbi:MAG TPA: MBL fold metallo-hydrolase [Nocardioidaceae bacterium]|nr:MBL fold metallo-hydrolase [Nocardioidaceae bacterium]